MKSPKELNNEAQAMRDKVVVEATKYLEDKIRIAMLEDKLVVSCPITHALQCSNKIMERTVRRAGFMVETSSSTWVIRWRKRDLRDKVKL